MDSSEGTAQRELLAQNCCWNDQINNDLGGKGKGEGDNLPMKASTKSRREEHTAGWVVFQEKKTSSSENHKRLQNQRAKDWKGFGKY